MRELAGVTSWDEGMPVASVCAFVFVAKGVGGRGQGDWG